MKTNTTKQSAVSTEKEKQKAANMPDIFNGPIVSTTVKLVLPIILGQISSIIQLFVDTFYISLIDRQSTALISATGLIFPLFLIFFAISIGISTGVSSLVARAIGEKNKHVIDKVADSALLLCIIICLSTLALGIIFGPKLIQLFAGSQLTSDTIKYANDFFHYLLPGISVLLFVHMLGGIIGGEGLTKYFGIGWLISNATNIILAPVFIFTMGMGVKGAGLASTLAILSALLYMASVLFRRKTIVIINWNIFKANSHIIKEIIRIGAPVCLMMLSTNIAVILLNNLVGSISQAAMNSWILVGRMDQIISLPAMSLSGVTIAMIGQNYGRGILHRVEKIFYAHIALILIACGILCTAYTIFAAPIFKVFSAVPEVITGSTRQVYYTSFTWLAVSAIMVINASFQATGKALPSLFITIIRVLILMAPLALLSVYVFKLGMTGIFYGIIISNIITLIIAVAWGRFHIKGLYKKQPVIAA
jgi:putative MATE family efflux protein